MLASIFTITQIPLMQYLVKKHGMGLVSILISFFKHLILFVVLTIVFAEIFDIFLLFIVKVCEVCGYFIEDNLNMGNSINSLIPDGKVDDKVPAYNPDPST